MLETSKSSIMIVIPATEVASGATDRYKKTMVYCYLCCRWNPCSRMKAC